MRIFAYVIMLLVLLQSIKGLPLNSTSSIDVKKQYYKPSIDGSWLANERGQLLKQSRNKTTIGTISTVSDAKDKWFFQRLLC